MANAIRKASRRRQVGKLLRVGQRLVTSDQYRTKVLDIISRQTATSKVGDDPLKHELRRILDGVGFVAVADFVNESGAIPLVLKTDQSSCLAPEWLNIMVRA